MQGLEAYLMVQAESGFTSPSFWDSSPLKRQKQVRRIYWSSKRCSDMETPRISVDGT